MANSLELCRGLDSHGFADLDAAVTLNCSLATYYPKGHAMRAKWNQGSGIKPKVENPCISMISCSTGPAPFRQIYLKETRNKAAPPS